VLVLEIDQPRDGGNLVCSVLASLSAQLRGCTQLLNLMIAEVVDQCGDLSGSGDREKLHVK
jgi:hypothetical protein